jgi:predicted GTPase
VLIIASFLSTNGIPLFFSLGKSSTGNSLLHSRSAFHAVQAGQSITRDCQAQRSQYVDQNGQQKTLTVVDTPGFFDTDKTVTNESVEKKIASQIFNMTAPGVHAFLIVIRVGRFTPEEKNTVDFIRHIFGRDAVKYCIVVFTGEDQLDEGQTPEEFINTSSALRELVQACGNRTFAINNKLSGQQLERKTKRLIEIIDNMVRNNNGTYYTNDEYQRIERQRRETQQRQEEEELRKKKAQEDAFAARVSISLLSEIIHSMHMFLDQR